MTIYKKDTVTVLCCLDAKKTRRNNGYAVFAELMKYEADIRKTFPTNSRLF